MHDNQREKRERKGDDLKPLTILSSVYADYILYYVVCTKYIEWGKGTAGQKEFVA
jgi:hypothetical protein